VSSPMPCDKAVTFKPNRRRASEKKTRRELAVQMVLICLMTLDLFVLVINGRRAI